MMWRSEIPCRSSSSFVLMHKGTPREACCRAIRQCSGACVNTPPQVFDDSTNESCRLT